MISENIHKVRRGKTDFADFSLSHTSTLLSCFVLEHSDFKTKQLRSVLVKLLVPD